MLCAIYKSSKKNETYLYLPKRDDFSGVPDALMGQFGTPQFVMMLELTSERKLQQADINKVRDELKSKGFYLQIPPPAENLLKQHRVANGAENNS